MWGGVSIPRSFKTRAAKTGPKTEEEKEEKETKDTESGRANRDLKKYKREMREEGTLDLEEKRKEVVKKLNEDGEEGRTDEDLWASPKRRKDMIRSSSLSNTSTLNNAVQAMEPSNEKNKKTNPLLRSVAL